MARTKQTERKPTGGKAPRRAASSSATTPAPITTSSPPPASPSLVSIPISSEEDLVKALTSVKAHLPSLRRVNVAAIIKKHVMELVLDEAACRQRMGTMKDIRCAQPLEGVSQVKVKTLMIDTNSKQHTYYDRIHAKIQEVTAMRRKELHLRNMVGSPKIIMLRLLSGFIFVSLAQLFSRRPRSVSSSSQVTVAIFSCGRVEVIEKTIKPLVPVGYIAFNDCCRIDFHINIYYSKNPHGLPMEKLIDVDSGPSDAVKGLHQAKEGTWQPLVPWFRGDRISSHSGKSNSGSRVGSDDIELWLPRSYVAVT